VKEKVSNEKSEKKLVTTNIMRMKEKVSNEKSEKN
jgi:hypothetical protein